jgi:hypothetical protein
VPPDRPEEFELHINQPERVCGERWQSRQSDDTAPVYVSASAEYSAPTGKKYITVWQMFVHGASLNQVQFDQANY